MTRALTVAIGVVAVLATACAGADDRSDAQAGGTGDDTTSGDRAGQESGSDAEPCDDGVFYWQAGCTPAASVDLDTIISGGPPPDGIPPIDDPVFESIEAADEWLDDNSPVQVVRLAGRTKAYPLAVLTWHEIVNDELAGIPVVVTYCPLCNSGLVFERTIAPPDGGDEEELTFGTSGRLRFSNLIMYDRQHKNLWQQFNGEAIVGAHFLGATLSRLPSQLIGFGELKQTDPDAQVLSRDTGVTRDYGRNPYVRYDDDGSEPFLYRGPTDARLEQMERVVGLGAGTAPVAVVLEHLRSEQVVEVDVGGDAVVLFWAPGQASALDDSRIDDSRDVGQTGAFRPTVPDGTHLTFSPTADEEGARFVDDQTGSTWNLLGEAVDGPLAGERLRSIAHDDTFWFVWFAFQPETRIVGQDAA